MRFMCAFFISVPVSRDKTLINCFNERDLLSFFLSFFLTFLLTSSPPLDYKVGLCNQKCFKDVDVKVILAHKAIPNYTFTGHN